MSSLIYDSFVDKLCTGAINPSSDTFKVMLIAPGGGYTPSKTADIFRSAATAGEASGTGYTSGGVAVTCTVAKNTGSNQETLTFSNPSWAGATISAVGAVIYKSRGGLASADELVAYVDFGGTVTSTAGTFAVTFSSPLTFQL